MCFCYNISEKSLERFLWSKTAELSFTLQNTSISEYKQKVDLRLIVKTHGVRISLGGKLNIFQVTITIKDGRCDFKEGFQ